MELLEIHLVLDFHQVGSNSQPRLLFLWLTGLEAKGKVWLLPGKDCMERIKAASCSLGTAHASVSLTWDTSRSGNILEHQNQFPIIPVGRWSRRLIASCLTALQQWLCRGSWKMTGTLLHDQALCYRGILCSLQPGFVNAWTVAAGRRPCCAAVYIGTFQASKP